MKWTEASDEEYNKALAGEGEYWDSFVAERLMRGEIPGSIDWRLTFTQFRFNHQWRPFCLGPAGINFRLSELHYLLGTAAPRPGMRVLDLGCGAGWLGLELARRGAHVTALDISPTNLAIGRYIAETNTRNSPYLYKNFAGVPYDPALFGSIEYRFADLNHTQLPKDEFDAIVVWDSLHHIANLEGLLEEVRGALKPGGAFVGIDHAVATEETWAYNDATMSQIEAINRWVGDHDPHWLYQQVEAMGKQADLGVLAVDYDSTPVPGWEPFLQTLCAEMLEIVQSGTKAAGITKQTPDISAHTSGDEEESPFEDVSNERLVRTLLDTFHMQRFTTTCPYIKPETHFPAYRSDEERIFQHYLSAMLVKAGAHAITEGFTDGQWFLFHATPAQPDPTMRTKLEERAKRSVSGHAASLYTQSLEREIERKNAAIADLQERLRRQEAELARGVRVKLPWKR
ncbi:MAG TPA: class I SAM-dependent methyltransferase [Chloroflexia bacterium]|nr:class I SAM-dependent methyltransferase [Chloroflexia bacterium]